MEFQWLYCIHSCSFIHQCWIVGQAGFFMGLVGDMGHHFGLPIFGRLVGRGQIFQLFLKKIDIVRQPIEADQLGECGPESSPITYVKAHISGNMNPKAGRNFKQVLQHKSTFHSSYICHIVSAQIIKYNILLPIFRIPIDFFALKFIKLLNKS